MSGSAPVLSVPVCEGGLGPARRIGRRPLCGFTAALRLWGRLSRAGRCALVVAYSDAVETARPGAVLPLPRLDPGADPRTVAALRRHGLVADGALTPFAVEVLALVGPAVRYRVETRRPVGDLL